MERGARLKLQAEKSYDQISLCVMDAKHLALAGGRIPCVTSFFGFNNIPETQEAFQEVSRVLAPEGCLVFSCLWLKEGSRSLKLAEELGYGAVATEERLTQILGVSGFKLDSTTEYYSGRWPHNPMDRIPLEGDWFAHVLIRAHKV